MVGGSLGQREGGVHMGSSAGFINKKQNWMQYIFQITTNVDQNKSYIMQNLT